MDHKRKTYMYICHVETVVALEASCKYNVSLYLSNEHVIKEKMESLHNVNVEILSDSCDFLTTSFMLEEMFRFKVNMGWR
jgi:hypothetical protein